MYKEEKLIRGHGFNLIAGVDEAGRGPLAGPVVAAAVIFDANYKNKDIDDSKKLTPIERERLFIDIKNSALSYAVGIVGWKQIDEMGILNASKLAMRQAVLKLDPLPDFVLIDAVEINIPGIPQKAIIGGDALVFSIAAASIIAKVTRDRLMTSYHKKYPEYGFDQHMGYGTELHMRAIKKHGPCNIHRLTFAPFSDRVSD
jgi:ribonuclease HII